VRFKRYSDSSLTKKARRGFRGYPIATIAFYGPDDKRASKAAVAILHAQGAEPTVLERWFAEERDVRTDPAVGSEILRFVRDHGAKSVVMTDRIIGCPHEEGVDGIDFGCLAGVCSFELKRTSLEKDTFRHTIRSTQKAKT
jgi:hypothetical protein